MSLFTSSSSWLNRFGKGSWGSQVLFLAAFAVTAGFGSLHFATSEDLQARLQAIKQYPRAIPKGNFLAHYRGAIEHDVFVHNLVNFVEPLKNADVVFVGHSRLGRALDKEVARNFFSDKGLSYYQLAMGHRDGHPLVSQLFEKHDIKPKLLVISANLFFESFKSRAYLAAMAKSKWQAIKGRMEKEVTYSVLRVLHSFLPHLNPMVGDGLVFRDIQSGHWSKKNYGDQRFPIVLEKDRERIDLSDEVINNGMKFYNWLGGRGGELVMTWIPTSKDEMILGELDRLSEQLESPLIYVEKPHWQTFDKSHLDNESAKEWTQLFLRALSQRAEFKRLLGP